MLDGTGVGAGDRSGIRGSPSVWMSVTLVVVHVVVAIMSGDFLSPDVGVVWPFLQVNELVWRGWVWMLFTALFLHLNLVHFLGNVMFLLIFGTSLEEQVSRFRWVVTYFACGLAGNLAFLLIGPFIGQEVGLGASGAVYGLLGAAAGVRGAFIVIFFLGLNIFSGGGFLAHLGGLFVGLALRQYWDQLVRILGVGPREPTGTAWSIVDHSD